ncbi:uncharacterized protein V1510DRAFT_310288 [Dipodascopsis tothii]|uniref:uncharacterized protein n=1 Tax=Dipodascopsis tothii TaxID=44089 RepID=UPI0034CE9E57
MPVVRRYLSVAQIQTLPARVFVPTSEDLAFFLGRPASDSDRKTRLDDVVYSLRDTIMAKLEAEPDGTKTITQTTSSGAAKKRRWAEDGGSDDDNVAKGSKTKGPAKGPAKGKAKRAAKDDDAAGTAVSVLDGKWRAVVFIVRPRGAKRGSYLVKNMVLLDGGPPATAPMEEEDDEPKKMAMEARYRGGDLSGTSVYIVLKKVKAANAAGTGDTTAAGDIAAGAEAPRDGGATSPAEGPETARSAGDAEETETSGMEMWIGTQKSRMVSGNDLEER